MENGDEIQRLCIEARELRLQASTVAGHVTMAICELRQSLAEREKLRMWSTELRAGGGERSG